MSESTTRKFTLTLDINEVHAVEAGLRLLTHFNAKTCIVTDRGGCPSHVKMEELDKLVAQGGKPLTQRELAALARRVRYV